MKSNTQKMVKAAMLAALCCVVTMFIKVPSPFKGYVNLGDCVVLISGWFLSPVYGFFAAALGSGLADVFSGYAIYAPVTFVIKGVMALIAHYSLRAMCKNQLVAKIAGGIVAECVMVMGYFVFEGFLYGFAPSAVNIPINGVQGAVGLIAGLALAKIVSKTKIF